MERANFTQYDEFPREMLIYMRHYGPHFNRKLFDFAASLMTKEVDGQEQQVQPYTKEQVEALLKKHNIKIMNDQLYDSSYVATMCRADFLGKSVPDEQHLALYVKDVIDDVDAADGTVFNRWYADMCYNGIAVDWEEML